MSEGFHPAGGAAGTPLHTNSQGWTAPPPPGQQPQPTISYGTGQMGGMTPGVSSNPDTRTPLERYQQELIQLNDFVLGIQSSVQQTPYMPSLPPGPLPPALLPHQQTGFGDPGATFPQMPQSLLGFQFPPSVNTSASIQQTPWLPTLPPVALPQQQTLLGNAGATFTQMPPQASLDFQFTPPVNTSASVQQPLWLPTLPQVPLPQQQTGFGNAGANFTQMPQASLDFQFPPPLNILPSNVAPQQFGFPASGVSAEGNEVSNLNIPQGGQQRRKQAEVKFDSLNPSYSLGPAPPLLPPRNILPSSNPPLARGINLQPSTPNQNSTSGGSGRSVQGGFAIPSLPQAHNTSRQNVSGNLQKQKPQPELASSILERQLPTPDLRRQALQDVRARLFRRVNPNDVRYTVHGAIEADMTKAECWIEWCKEKKVDPSIHEKRKAELADLKRRLGPEDTSLPPSQEQQVHADFGFSNNPIAPTHEPARRPPLQLAQMDLSQIQYTKNPNDCHWCQSEQPWGIPGGLHFKKPTNPSVLAPALTFAEDGNGSGNADDGYISTMCMPCGSHRYKIGTHATHGKWQPLPTPSSALATSTTDPYFANVSKTYMRQTSCTVCSGMATAICGGCPMRVCPSCEVSLDRMCVGNYDRLLHVYGEEGRRNDARLMGSKIAWDRRVRAGRPGEGVSGEV